MTDRLSEKRNFLCRVTYFFSPQFCNQSQRLNLLNSLFVQRLLYFEWKSYCLDRPQRNYRNKSNNAHFVHSFHLLKIHFAPCNILGLLRDTWEVINVEKKAFVAKKLLLLLLFEEVLHNLLSLLLSQDRSTEKLQLPSLWPCAPKPWVCR